MDKDIGDILDAIKSRDEQVRIKAEKELLDQAIRYGKSENPELQGKVLLGITQKLIEISANSREIIAVLPSLQTKSECAQAMGKHVKGLNLPTNITIWAVICAVVGVIAKLAGWV